MGKEIRNNIVQRKKRNRGKYIKGKKTFNMIISTGKGNKSDLGGDTIIELKC